MLNAYIGPSLITSNIHTYLSIFTCLLLEGEDLPAKGRRLFLTASNSHIQHRAVMRCCGGSFLVPGFKSVKVGKCEGPA